MKEVVTTTLANFLAELEYLGGCNCLAVITGDRVRLYPLGAV